VIWRYIGVFMTARQKPLMKILRCKHDGMAVFFKPRCQMLFERKVFQERQVGGMNHNYVPPDAFIEQTTEESCGKQPVTEQDRIICYEVIDATIKRYAGKGRE